MKFTACLLFAVVLEVASKAMATAAVLNKNDTKPYENELQLPKYEDPVIIVGGGLAGLSATLQAIQEGANVVLIEGEKDLGGNSQKASSGVAACNTKAQEMQHIIDSPELFYSDTMSSGDYENDRTLVDILVHESPTAIQYLIDHGINLTDVNLCGGHSVKRVHWIPQRKDKPIAVGFEIMKALKNLLKKLSEENPEKVHILLETEVVGLVTWNDFVTGVRIKNGSRIDEVSGKAVILATGGFSCDRAEDGSLLAEFAPDKMVFPTTNGPWARGRGVKMARAMGASLVGMKYVQVHPTSFIDPEKPNATTKFLAAEALRGKGAILLNEKGERFANELGRRDYLTDRILHNTKNNTEAGGVHTAYMLMDQKAVDDFGPASFNFYAKTKKFFKEFNTLEEVAKYIGVEPTEFEQTINAYNQLAKSEEKKEDQFGKKVFPVAFEHPPYYAALITPAIHYTMGGLKIDKDAQVYNEYSGKPFRGLLAAGEVTGGVHGRNRLAGNSLLECVVYGRIAGRNAAHIRYTPEDAVVNRSDL